ncbi:hypothetical protein L1887_08712 [Cichorium endivia]|nr:hypothetical protein L1887_08712 [Cichorium endivia]
MSINSCYSHCQTGIQETWLRNDSPLLANTVVWYNILTLRQWCANNFPQAKELLEHLYNEYAPAVVI